jgi:hypothetical protein
VCGELRTRVDRLQGGRRQYGHGTGVVRRLLRAIATARTAADLLDEADSRLELALQLTVAACGAAALPCRQAGLDESILRSAAACERAADEAELVLTAIAHDAPGHS